MHAPGHVARGVKGFGRWRCVLGHTPDSGWDHGVHHYHPGRVLVPPLGLIDADACKE